MQIQLERTGGTLVCLALRLRDGQGSAFRWVEGWSGAGRETEFVCAR